MRSNVGLVQQRGLSLVEMMVGIAVGLFVVAGAVTLVTAQLGDNRRLLLETQLQQDLRATTDIITRELRRAGYTTQAQQGVWFPDTAQVQKNTFADLTPDAGTASETVFRYRRGPGAEGPYGFKLVDGVIKTQLAASGWQDLTDGNVIKVTAFTIQPQNEVVSRLPCPRLCADGTQACWPTLTVREMLVDVTAEAVSDPAVQRSIRTSVRLRNDWVRFNDVANPDRICPL